MPRDGSATRERILASAEALVLEHGFAATSVDEVIAASGTSKGAFFHHFTSKAELGRGLVERYARADREHLATFMAEAERLASDPLDEVVAFVGLLEEAADELVSAQPSCLYVSFTYERQLLDGEAGDAITDAIADWRETIAAKLRAATADRPSLADLDVEALADHVFVTFEGAFILARATGDGTHMRRQLGVLRRSLEALLAA